MHRIAILSLLLFVGCAPINSDFDDKTRWMQRNYPDRSSNLEKIQYQEKYRQAILNGQVMFDMSLDEALVAGDIVPFGPRPGSKVFWCMDRVVEKCAAACQDCRAMLVRKKELHFFESGERGLQVVASYANHKWSAQLSYIPTSYSAARAIMRNEYQIGMHFDDMLQVDLPKRASTRYFCSEGQTTNQSATPCSEQCTRCRVEIQIPRIGQHKPRLIQLWFKQRILDRIQERELANPS